MGKKTVLVTGASRGIGKAIAERFAIEDFNIVINCRNSFDKLLEIERNLKKINSNVFAVKCDVAKYDEVKDMFQNIYNVFGGVDILVNNAGIAYIGLFNEMVPEQWNELIDVNLKGVYNCSHLALPYMIHNKAGSIVNISSVWGNVGASCEVVYSSVKGAVNSFSKALAKELGPSNIKVNAVACGVIETEMNDFLSLEEKNSLIEEIPLMRFGNTKEVAEVVYFLSSSASDYMSGQVITLDGAWI